MMSRSYKIILTICLVAVVGTVVFLYVPSQPTMKQPSPLAPTVYTLATYLDISPIPPPPGWRAISETSSSDIFTDLPATATVFYDSDAASWGNGNMASDTLGYSDISINRISVRPGYTQNATAMINSGSPQDLVNGKLVTPPVSPDLPAGIGFASMVFENSSTYFNVGIVPYVPFGATTAISPTPKDMQTYRAFLDSFARELP